MKAYVYQLVIGDRRALPSVATWTDVNLLCIVGADCTSMVRILGTGAVRACRYRIIHLIFKLFKGCGTEIVSGLAPGIVIRQRRRSTGTGAT